MKQVAILLSIILACGVASPVRLIAATADGKHKLVIIAGKPSHPPRMHEFHAGSMLLASCLKDVPGLVVDLGFNGWVSDEKALDDADAVVIYADGGAGNPAIQKDHLETLSRLAKKGVGIAFMHYGVEIPVAKGGPEFQKWIGGYYEDKFSCNPMWEPHFDSFPEHPITRGVHPFHNRDEWYINMRWAEGFSSDKASTGVDGTKFWPILVDKPSDAVRNGPYVAPRGPYPHVVAASGKPDAMMWAVERPDGGRGFGFVGGHSHDNWGNDDQRKVVLNAMVWLAKLEVPANGVESKVTKEQLDQNLDRKGR
ncbi:MAG TPA: ThuA domain-containing protein [Tepidisphaeraceae bacterium]|jgi:type 1 glutamine amidotransferase